MSDTTSAGLSQRPAARRDVVMPNVSDPRTPGRSSLFAVGVRQAPTVLPRATTNPWERVQMGANAARLWSVKSLQGSKNSEASRQAGGHWFEPSTAHILPCKEATSVASFANEIG